MQRKSILFSVLLALGLSPLMSQHSFINAAFEGTPQDATVPQGWYICEEGSTPDILPGPWGVYNEAAEGETYIGLITRPDGSFESIGQRMNEPLITGECYDLYVDLATSHSYTGYNESIKLRIWLGTNKCERTQLLLESDFITVESWIPHKINFTAEAAHQYIIIEAYTGSKSKRKRGNILVDNLSSIRLCKRT